MPDSPTISNAPPEHPALDYAFLRQEGIRHLERLVGHLWTDFNTHDPGVTILEQLCYAITDLAYRASHDVPDLLAGGGSDPYRSLYSPATILTSRPVTPLDLRKLILDVEGVKNAWIEEVRSPRLPLHHREGRRELGVQSEPPYTAPVLLKGLYRIALDISELDGRDAGSVRQEVVRRLHACRPLCTDFEEIQVLTVQPIQVQAEVEIGPVDDAEGVLLGIYDALSEHVSPSARFTTLGELLAAGKRSDEIFDGPALRHGFLDTEALDRMTRRGSIYTSDLIREIMDVPGVRAVRNITASSGGAPQAWRLRLDTSRAPRFDPHRSAISLVKGRLTARLDTSRIIEALSTRRDRAASSRELSANERDILPPRGRDRKVGQYHSIQHQFPAIYGIGTMGLPDSATPKRKAQAKQLKAYLLFFDQLLANYFAQLAQVGSLFSFHRNELRPDDDQRTYFAQAIDDPTLGLDPVLGLDDPRDADARRDRLNAHQARLKDITESTVEAQSRSKRKVRFLNHLMARFAEQFTDYSLVVLGAASREARPTDDQLVSDMMAFLQRYPRISGERGTGFDALSPRGAENTSGLEERIQRKLGLDAAAGERFFLIEHLLLRPLDEDHLTPGEREEHQSIPLLADSFRKDPCSLQVSFVFPSFPERLRLPDQAGSVNELRLLAEQTVREETPAHLTPYLHWLDQADWEQVESAYHRWLETYRSYLAAKLDLEPMSAIRHLHARDARDRLIDLLGIGETYPLRDLPVRDERLTVPFNQVARIPIDASQRGVIYELRGEGDRVFAQSEGNGETLFLETPPMREDTTYSILARKLATGREAYLQQKATVKVGLDVTLRARILEAVLLDPGIETPADGDPRLVAHGTRVRVQILESQEGVDYRLIHVAGSMEHPLSPAVRGTGGEIELAAEPAHEDLDLRIRATKVFDPSENRETQTALLDIVLPLKVRARLDNPVSPEPSAVVGFGEGMALRIDDTQTSASYRLYSRAVLDSEFVFGAAGQELLAADVEGEPRVHAQRPPERPIWEDLEGFAPLGAAVPGNGGTLRLPLDGLTSDSVILVRAQKEHRVSATVSLSSSVQLRQAALILVRPDPRPAIRLGVVMNGDRTTGTLEITGGQPGVFYHVRRAPDGEDLGLPAYFHKTDERDARLNKGIDALRIEVDVAISRGTQRPATTAAELSATPPLAPLLSTGPLDAGTTLHFRAVKAQTRVGTPLAETARIAPVPEIRAEQATVASGSPAVIVVRGSLAGDRYQITQDGQAIGAPRDGDGSELRFTTGPLLADSRFEVLVTHPGEPGIPVQRRVEIRISVAPGS